jgi:hypothetical protein
LTSRPKAETTVRAAAAAGWVLERHAHGRLAFVSAAGTRHEDVDVLRAFPVSAARGPVAIVDGDGGELAWIESLAEITEPLRSLVERELAEREFLPVIQRIDAVSDGEPAEWTVTTDRGPHRFKVGHVDDVVRQPDGVAFVTDTHGIRYLIPDIDALDGTSRRLFEKMF